MNEKTAHTPGPWFVDYLDRNGQRVVRQQHIEICTCWHHCVGSIEKEMEANARLIAAAPNMMLALQDIKEKLCEGFCSDFPSAETYDAAMDNDCSACRARAVLASAEYRP